MRIGKQIDECPFVPLVISYPKAVNYGQIQSELSPSRERVQLFFLTQSTYEIPPANDHVICHMKYLRDVGSENYCSLVDVMHDAMTILSEPEGRNTPIGIVSRRTPDLACYFIVQWLIDEKGIPPESALAIVAESLPPGITKRKYIHKLNRTYGISLNESVEFVYIPVPAPSAEPIELDSVPRASTPDAAVKRVSSGRVDQVELKAADALLDEVYDQCRIPGGRIPLSERVQITHATIERVMNDASNQYCLMLEPDGERCIMFLKSGKCFLFYSTQKSLFLRATYTFTGTAVIEGVLVKKDESSTFVMCDLLSLNSERMDDKPFRVRMGLLKHEIFSTWKASPEDTTSLALQPFYHMKAYEKVMDVFTTRKRKFTRYPCKGLTMIPVMSTSHSYYAWSVEPPRPCVIVHIDYRNEHVYGHATTKSTNIVVAYLGDITPETSDLNGQLVEIDVVEKSHVREDLLTGVVHRPVQDREPWSIADFWRHYPDQNPHFKPEQMQAELARIAELPQYNDD